jgi:putative SOS response-associated peptidase YedK
MCGRYTVTSAPEAIRALFRYPERPNFPPRYNVPPTQPIPTVCLVEGRRQFTLVRLGLLPSWVKDPNTFALLLNARGQSGVDKPAFRAATKRRALSYSGRPFLRLEGGGRAQSPLLRAA